ncbi:nitrous oxide reductase accessory protein NosL [Fodinibius sp.]|uniref:nitrous oxide reductase accessory protein NosL n=1 Tax=Fodinibius sp. TaxID=1872440 RepID=UPI003567D031
MMKRITTPFIFALSLWLLATACSQEPADIHYGSDECAHCKMMITDNRFASQIVTEKGKAYKFDAIECMTAYANEHPEVSEGALRYVSNYAEGGTWLRATEAQYVKSEVVNSPMGESLLAFPSPEAAKRHIAERPGKLLGWEVVSQLGQ